MNIINSKFSTVFNHVFLVFALVFIHFSVLYTGGTVALYLWSRHLFLCTILLMSAIMPLDSEINSALKQIENKTSYFSDTLGISPKVFSIIRIISRAVAYILALCVLYPSITKGG